jgi:hypothetical protein
MLRLYRLTICTLIALLSGCYHLAYNQATYAVEHGDFATAADKNLEALEQAPDSPEARSLWERIWPQYRQLMVSACDTAAADPNPTTLFQHLSQFESLLDRGRRLQVATPDLTPEQLTQWHNLGASKAYHQGEGAETAQKSRDAADWYRLAQRFRSGYLDSATRFERNRKAAYVVLRIGDFSASGDAHLTGHGADDQVQAMVLQGLQPLNGDYLGVQNDMPAPDWVQHRYRLTGTVRISTSEPYSPYETGTHEGPTVSGGTTVRAKVTYVRHRLRRDVTATVDLYLRHEPQGEVVWQHGFTGSATDEHRWLTIISGPAAILPHELQVEATRSQTPPDWRALQDEAAAVAARKALNSLKDVATSLR